MQINKVITVIILSFFIAAFNVCAAQNNQMSPAPDTTKNLATIPSDANFKAHPDWNIRCAERVGAIVGKPCDALFIGDSITQNFTEDSTATWSIVDDQALHFPPGDRGFDLTGRAVWLKYYSGHHVLDFGVGADKTEHILWRMEKMDIRQLNPKVVVLLAGTNNIGYSTPQIAGGIKAVLNKIQQMFPDAHILLMSLTPRNNYVDKVISVNRSIKAYADDDKITYVDLFSKMVANGDGWLGIGHDKLHLTPQGYELWAATINPLLKKYIPHWK